METTNALRQIFQKNALGFDAFLEGTLWTMTTVSPHTIYHNGVSRQPFSDEEIIDAMEWLWDSDRLNATIINKSRGYAGETVFFMAIFHRYQKVAEWLLSHGADPRISPELFLSYDCYRPYLTSSTLAMAMIRNMTPDFIVSILNAGGNIHHINEYTQNNMMDLVVNNLRFLSPTRRIDYMRILLDYGATVQFSTMSYLIESYNYGDNLFVNVDLGSIIADVVWRYYGKDKCATKIQRVWRAHRRHLAAKKYNTLLA